MPNRWAVATGNWSNTATWNNGAVLGIPTGSDDVFISGSFTVTINQDITVNSLTNRASGSGAGAIAAGGTFLCSTTRNITANSISAGGGVGTGIHCLSLSGSGLTVNVNSNITGSNAGASSTFAVNIICSSSIVNINGNILAIGNNIANAVSCTGTSNIINITGSIVGGSVGVNEASGLIAAGTTNTYIVSGSVTGGSKASSTNAGISLGGTSNILRVIGNLTGGSGTGTNPGLNINTTSPYTASIIGNIVGGPASSGILNSATGTGSITIVGDISGSGATGFNTTGNNSTITITGSMVGGVSTNAHGVAMSGNSHRLTISGSTIISSTGNNTVGLGLAGSFHNINIICNTIRSIGGSSGTAPGIQYSSANSTASIVANSIIGGVVGTDGNGGINVNGSGNIINVTGNFIGGSAPATGVAPGFYVGLTNNNRFTLIGDTVGTVSNHPGINFASVSNSTLNYSGSIRGFGMNWNTITATTASITGSITGGNGLGSSGGGTGLNILNTNGVIFNIIGNVLGSDIGSTTSYGINMASGVTNTTINLIGNVAAGVGSIGILNLAPSTTILNVSGSVAGEFTNGGIVNNAGSIVNIIGDVIGASGLPTSTGAGVSNTSTGAVTVVGTARARVVAGILNTSTGRVTVTSAVASDSASAVANSGTSITTFENMTFGSNGRLAITGLARLRASANNFISCSLEPSGSETLIDINNVTIGMPSPSNVRSGTSYNFGNNVGTMVVPTASNVLLGIPVDNTTGSATLTTSSFRDAVWTTDLNTLTGSTGTIGNVAIQASTVDSFGDQLTSLL